MLKKFKGFKANIKAKYNAFEINVSKTIDKYQIIRRSYIVGCALNAFLTYKAIKKIAILNEVETYIDRRRF